MEQVNLTAWPREGLGKEKTGRLRKEGFIPAVLYGPGIDNTKILKLEQRAVNKALTSHSIGNMFINLSIDGCDKDVTVLIKQLDRHPANDTVVHMDLINVLMDHAIHADVPIVLTGKSVGVIQQGGVLQQEHRTVKVECLPSALPESLEIDVTTMENGQSLHLKDLTLPEGVKIMEDLDLTIVLVSAPRAIVEKTQEEAEAELADSLKDEEGADAASGEEEKKEKKEKKD
jgi:large subunit ribosomal protein L25